MMQYKVDDVNDLKVGEYINRFFTAKDELIEVKNFCVHFLHPIANKQKKNFKKEILFCLFFFTNHIESVRKIQLRFRSARCANK